MDRRLRTPLAVALASLALAATVQACSGTGASTGSEATGGSSSTPGQGGAGGGSSGSGGGAQAGKGGSNGGEGGSPTDGGGLDVDIGMGGGSGSGPDDGGGVQDAKPDVENEAGCIDGGGTMGPGPLKQVCAPKTNSECDGKSDLNPDLPNGTSGNGFDDDCDGLVDEGCACDADHPVGTTRECFLVPSSQADPTTHEPVGWCTQNSRGTMACIQSGTGEFVNKGWDGFCKGAQPPFADDACAPGDFDCDGAQQNSHTEDCACKTYEVTCPTDPIVISPFPDPNDLEKKKANPFDPKPNQPFVIDGYQWIGGGAQGESTDWWWAVSGGDCDNILPHVTFAVYGSKVAAGQKPIGTEVNNVGSNGKQRAIFTAPSATQHQIWPAFSLSGDYIVSGAFKLGGKQYACSVKVQVRAPGLRAEMCWDMNKDAFGGLSSSDLDLHLARLQGAQCDGKHGWFDSCGKAPDSDDCYFTCNSGCRTGNVGFCAGQNAPPPGWGYAPSANDACHGWGSLREAQQSCDNPRLDRDNLGCNVTLTDPSAPTFLDNPLFNYCGPENINLDNPKNGDQFLVGVHFYGGSTAQPHVNIYCNGERKLALGSDPTATPPVTKPNLTTPFGQPMGATFFAGDMWEVARVRWTDDPKNPCAIEPIPSKNPKPDQDGSKNVCVDTNAQNKSSPTMDDLWLFAPGGSYPTSPQTPPENICWH